MFTVSHVKQIARNVAASGPQFDAVQRRGGLSLRRFLVAGLVGMTCVCFGRQTQAAGEWANYARDKSSSKYSPLDQIDAHNFRNLRVAWKWQSAETKVTAKNSKVKTWSWECTPLMVGGTLYVSTSICQVAALDPVTGRQLWIYGPESWKNGTPPNLGYVNRGVTYWAKGNDKRILIATGDAYLICLDAKTGKPILSFGHDGRIDLTKALGRQVDRRQYGVSSPPMVCGDIVVVGSSIVDFPMVKAMPPGDVRGYDVRTGKLIWTFHAVPHQGEAGAETWEKDSARYTGSANVWSLMSYDEMSGFLYLPFTTPSNDFYGGERLGSGLFGECLVCVQARTGKRIWSFQMIHHGLWDYDLPAAPNLLDITVGGKRIKAVAQVSKQCYCYVFDRVTGKPVWPIEERSVPLSNVPGEKSWPTQPMPTRPAPFDRQGLTDVDVIDFTPELHEKAMQILGNYHHGPLFTPPSLDRPTINLPGVAGGANWAGAAADPETGMLYVTSNTLPFAVQLIKSPLSNTRYFGTYLPVATIDGIPVYKPPYARVTAIDMNTGEHRWMQPLGRFPEVEESALIKPLGLPPTGRPSRAHLLLTKSLLLIAQEGVTQRVATAPDGGYATVADFAVIDPKLRAYNKENGAFIGEVDLPRNATASPMTYRMRGKQYIVVATGGANLLPEIVALALP